MNLDAREADADDAWTAWDAWSDAGGDSFGAAVVIGAVLEIDFPVSEDRPNVRSRLLKLYSPNGLVVRGWSPGDVAIAEHLLRKWGLLTSASQHASLAA